MVVHVLYGSGCDFAYPTIAPFFSRRQSLENLQGDFRKKKRHLTADLLYPPDCELREREGLCDFDVLILSPYVRQPSRSDRNVDTLRELCGKYG